MSGGIYNACGRGTKLSHDKMFLKSRREKRDEEPAVFKRRPNFVGWFHVWLLPRIGYSACFAIPQGLDFRFCECFCSNIYDKTADKAVSSIWVGNTSA